MTSVDVRHPADSLPISGLAAAAHPGLDDVVGVCCLFEG